MDSGLSASGRVGRRTNELGGEQNNSSPTHDEVARTVTVDRDKETREEAS